MEDCSQICIYVTNPLHESTPYLVHARPTSSPSGVFAPEFYQQTYNSQVDYPAAPLGGAPILPNAVYAQNTHPSEIPLAYDATAHLDNHFGAIANVVYQDNILPVPTGVAGPGRDTTSYARTVLAGPLITEFRKRSQYGSGGHAFAYGMCHWLAHCSTTSLPGSPCSATLSGVLYAGYCFESDSGSLECGRLAASDDEYSNAPKQFDKTQGYVAVVGDSVPKDPVVRHINSNRPVQTVASTPGESGLAYRCPVGSPAKGIGVFVSPRPFAAGCMISSDAAYDPLAEVHVPDYCSTPAPYLLGCMSPQADNYDPAARQVGPCRFATYGCTNPSMLKYSPNATIDDGSCVAKTQGCTVHSTLFEGVDSTTPGYRNGIYGATHRSDAGGWDLLGPEGGIKFEGPYPSDDFSSVAVLNYNPSANVLSSCVIAIEGCMDSTMVNYDPHANINSNTWCVPVVSGCMMPFAENSITFPAEVTSWSTDGMSTNYEISATVNNPASCQRARVGCVDSLALNYDPAATIQGLDDSSRCYYLNFGCLNPSAKNYACTARGDDFCNNPQLASYLEPSAQATVHISFFCKYQNEGNGNPPPPPPPGGLVMVPSGGGYKATVRQLITFAFVSAGSLAQNVAIRAQVMNNYLSTLTTQTGSTISCTAMVAYLRPSIGEEVGYRFSDSTCTNAVPFDDSTERRQLQQVPLDPSNGGGVNWRILLTVDDPALRDQLIDALDQYTAAGGATLEQVSALFQNIVGFTPFPGDVSTQLVITYERSGLTNAELAGVIVGVVIGTVLIMIGIAVYMRRKNKAAYAKTVVPA